jgi:hypothetical protein
MPRKRLFPPPQDPATGMPLQNKGAETCTVLTVNGRLTLKRRRYAGGVHPLDAWLDVAEATVSWGTRELACRLNQASRSFQKATENLARAAQLVVSDELLRQVVEAEGRAVLAAQRAGTLTISWTAADCSLPEAAGTLPATTRVYLGSDGVKLPLVTDAEKHARRTLSSSD